jgi:hypothetical protein
MIGQTNFNDLVEVLDVFDCCVISTIADCTQIKFVIGYKGMVYLQYIDICYVVFPHQKVFGVFE